MGKPLKIDHKKTKRSSLFMMLGFLVLITQIMSCSSDVQDQSDKASTAVFDVTAISASKSDDIGVGGNSPWSEVPYKKSVTFSACLNDITLQVPLQNQSLTVVTPLSTFNKETNSQGCLTWDEDFNFSYFEREKLVKYQVTFKGLQGHQGQETINLYVNPWASQLNKTVYDERFDELPEVQLENENLDQDFAPFILRNIRLSYFDSGFDQDTASAFYHFRVSAQMEARRKNLQNNPQSLNLEKGHFQFEAVLIEERAGEFQKLSHVSFSGELSAGQLQENLKFHILRGFQHHPDSRFYLHLKARPIGLPQQLGKALGLHEGILALSGLSGNSEGTLEPLENYPEALVSSPLKSDLILEEEEKNDLSGEPTEVAGEQENFALNIASAKAGVGVLLSQDPTTTTARVRRVPVEICLVDGLSQNSATPLRETKVRLNAFQSNVKDTDEERLSITNINGCFQSFVYLTYDYLGCEKFYKIDYNIEVLEGRYEGLKTAGKLALNPFNNQDFFYDLNQAVAPPSIACEAPQLAVSEFFYKNDGLVRSGFRLNQNLNLTLQKRYNIEFRPKFYRGSTYRELEGHQNLFHGKFNVKVSVFSPKNSEADYYTFREEEWDYVTSSQTQLDINANGLVAGDLNLPFHLSETLFLSFKNLLRVEIEPLQGLNLKKTVFTVPFFSMAQGARLNTSLKAGDLSAKTREKIARDLQYNFKVPGHHEELFRYEKNMSQGPLEVYRQEVIRLGKAANPSFRLIPGDYETFNKMPPVGKTTWDDVHENIVKEYKTQLSKVDFRTLSTNIGEIPKGYLSKFCRLFYQLPKANKRRTLLFGSQDTEVGGKKLKECINDPAKHIELVPMSFVEDLLGKRETAEVEGMEFSYITPRYKSDDNGKIKRGNAYFAAYGDRSSINWGERESESMERSLSYGLEGPSMIFVGSSERHSRSEETFRVKNTAEMRAAFNRNYTSRDVIDLTYNSITLNFTVRKRDCITLRSKTNVPLSYNFCRKDAQMKRVEETWFFIGDTNMENHGIISDGNLKGDPNRNQVIRGQQNFNLLWDQYETDDALLVVREIGTISVGDAFDKYISREKGLIPFENRYDHSFPGVILPFSHKPTTSCNGCQDP